MHRFHTQIGHANADVQVFYYWDVDYPVIERVMFQDIDITKSLTDVTLEDLEGEAMDDTLQHNAASRADAQIHQWESRHAN